MQYAKISIGQQPRSESSYIHCTKRQPNGQCLIIMYMHRRTGKTPAPAPAAAAAAACKAHMHTHTQTHIMCVPGKDEEKPLSIVYDLFTS